MFFRSMTNPDKDVTGEQSIADDESTVGLGFRGFLSVDLCDWLADSLCCKHLSRFD